MNLLHPGEFYKLSEDDCIEIQHMLSSQVIEHNLVEIEELKTVAGVDIAYWKEGMTERAVCCIVVIDAKTKQILEKQHTTGVVNFPYIPGCLAFRELPLVTETAAKLQRTPDLYLFDGNGLLHPRRMGLATHASFYLEAATLGIAKKYFCVEGAQFVMPEDQAGSYSDIKKDGRILGRAIRTHSHVKPVFASVGNYVDLDTVTKLALMFTTRESHIPIPTRYADLETHIERERERNQYVKI